MANKKEGSTKGNEGRHTRITWVHKFDSPYNYLSSLYCVPTYTRTKYLKQTELKKKLYLSSPKRKFYHRKGISNNKFNSRGRGLIHKAKKRLCCINCLSLIFFVAFSKRRGKK